MGLGLLPLAVPAPDLSLQVAMWAPVVTKSDRFRVNLMQFREYVDQRVRTRHLLPWRLGIPFRHLVTDDVTGHRLHHVEGHAKKIPGGLLQYDSGYRHRRTCQRLLDPGLATHVMSTGQQLTRRRPAQDHRAGLTGDLERQVRLAPGDESGAQRTPPPVTCCVRQSRAQLVQPHQVDDAHGFKSRSSRLRIFPVAVLGSSSMNSIERGYL